MVRPTRPTTSPKGQMMLVWLFGCLGIRSSDHILPSCFDPKSLETSDGQTVIKTEFVAHSVDHKEADVYLMITYGQVIPPTDSCLAPKTNNDRFAGYPSYSRPSYLEIGRCFCRVPDSGELRLPQAGERIHAPLDGYFTHTAQSLRSDRAQAKLSRYVATEHAHRSVAT
ncbi:hypothetical protein F2Q68_00025463 [Brassica cretica]|uniref:Uncharacterized protein n=1 Tax=Brassica cretica TaxID=69181 RepID=A0A8S9IBC0_BRACR|nr:hypothetical protein F2Q68_00025463 [Brassica cretica]